MSKLGSTLGTVIGGIAGSAVGMPSLGASIGGSLGGSIGGSGSKGAQEGSSTVGSVNVPSWLLPDLQYQTTEAKRLATTPLPAYTGQRVAQLTPDELQAQQYARNLGAGADLSYSQGINQQIANQGLNGPSQAQLNQYMNPYQQQVMDASRQRQLQQYDLAKRGLQQQQGQTGAFGGSRSAIAQGQLQDTFAQQLSQNEANQLYQGYSDAQNRAIQGAQLAGNAAQQYGQGQLQQYASGQQGLQGLSQAGALSRNINQQGLDVNYQDFLTAQQEPYKRLQFLQGIDNPIAGLTTSQSSQQTNTGGPSSNMQGTALGSSILGSGNLSSLFSGFGGNTGAQSYGNMLNTGGNNGFGQINWSGPEQFGPGFAEGGMVGCAMCGKMKCECMQGLACGGMVQHYKVGADDGPVGLYGYDQYPSQTTQESSGNPNAVSSAGAYGLKQLMPNTMRDPGYGVRPLQNDSPEENMRLGNDYLNALIKKYGDVGLGLAAYNYGPGAVDKTLKAGGSIEDMPKETRDYVTKLLPTVSAALSPAEQKAWNNKLVENSGPVQETDLARQPITAAQYYGQGAFTNQTADQLPVTAYELAKQQFGLPTQRDNTGFYGTLRSIGDFAEKIRAREPTDYPSEGTGREKIKTVADNLGLMAKQDATILAEPILAGKRIQHWMDTPSGPKLVTSPTPEYNDGKSAAPSTPPLVGGTSGLAGVQQQVQAAQPTPTDPLGYNADLLRFGAAILSSRGNDMQSLGAGINAYVDSKSGTAKSVAEAKQQDIENKIKQQNADSATEASKKNPLTDLMTQLKIQAFQTKMNAAPLAYQTAYNAAIQSGQFTDANGNPDVEAIDAYVKRSQQQSLGQIPTQAVASMTPQQLAQAEIARRAQGQ